MLKTRLEIVKTNLLNFYTDSGDDSLVASDESQNIKGLNINNLQLIIKGVLL